VPKLFKGILNDLRHVSESYVFTGTRNDVVFFRYLVQGISLNALGYLFYSMLVYSQLLSSILLASVFSALALLPIAYLANRKLVFKSSNPMREEVLRYFLVYGASVVFNLVLLWTVSKAIPNPYLSQAISSGVVLVTTFLLNTLWTFNGKA
jgi:putative flippase GtrA